MKRTLTSRLLILIAIFAITGCSDKDSAATQTPAATAETTPDRESGSLRIDYRGDPDPPREGDNDVQVTIAQDDGSRLTDAEVSITYYMPAMPSMNMPEMRDVFSLSHQGEGTYSGTVRLSMGGTWQVTVAVARRGEAVGKKRFTIIARE